MVLGLDNDGAVGRGRRSEAACCMLMGEKGQGRKREGGKRHKKPMAHIWGVLTMSLSASAIWEVISS